MGWTWFHKPEYVTPEEWFKNDYLRTEKFEILETAVINNTLYAAVKTKETGEVWAAVVLLDFNENDKYNNFGYKAMDEFYGPFETDCPESILRRLTPTENPYALEWRRKCWEKKVAV